MLTTIFILYLIFVSFIVVGISFLLIYQDKEIRRMKSVLANQAAHDQNNTKELEKFYTEKKQLQTDKDNEIAAIQAQLRDERNISALALKNAQTAKAQLNQQQEDISRLKSDIQKISEELQKTNESRLRELQDESQKWNSILQSKEISLQKLGSEASNMESVMDTLALISKEMRRRLDEHYSKMKLLDEETQENLGLLAQLERII